MERGHPARVSGGFMPEYRFACNQFKRYFRLKRRQDAYAPDVLNSYIFPGKDYYKTTHEGNLFRKEVFVMASTSVKVCAVTDAEQLRALSGEAEFVCSRCGATAHNKANVCEPVKYEPDH